jgi:hypothetical protein
MTQIPPLNKDDEGFKAYCANWREHYVLKLIEAERDRETTVEEIEVCQYFIKMYTGRTWEEAWVTYQLLYKVEGAR